MRVFWKNVRRMARWQKNDKTERARGLGRKTRDRKGESNDSPEIPDRSEISDIPGLPSGYIGQISPHNLITFTGRIMSKNISWT